MGALFTTVPSIRVSRVGRVRVTLTVTVRLVGLALWLVSGIALNKGIPVNGGPKFLYHVKQHISNSQRYLVVGLVGLVG